MKTPTHITLPSGSYLLVEVPEDAKQIVVFDNITEKFLSWYDGDDPPHPDHGEALPAGNWELIGKASEMENKHWEKIVERVDYDLPPSPGNDWQGDWSSAYKDYVSQDQPPNAEFPYLGTPTRSGLSLLTHHGYKQETVLILKQII